MCQPIDGNDRISNQARRDAYEGQPKELVPVETDSNHTLGCIFCNRVKDLFSKKNVNFHNVDRTIPHRHASMAGTTVPEVWFSC